MSGLPPPPPRHPASQQKQPAYQPRIFSPSSTQIDSAQRPHLPTPPAAVVEPYIVADETPATKPVLPTPLDTVSTLPFAISVDPPSPSPATVHAEVLGTTPPTITPDNEHEDDELMDSLADQIAATTPVAPTPSASVGPPSATLRRRLTNLSTRSTVSNASTVTGKTAEEVDKDEMTRALEELEDVEVAAFLARVGSRIQEVTVPLPREAIEFPPRPAFEDATGQVDWVAYSRAYFSVALAAYTPQSLIAAPKRTTLSLSLGRNQAERLYILAPPAVIESVLEGRLARIWRWESENTWKWCSLYVLLWIFDLIPFFFPSALLFFLLRSRLFPPTPEEILVRSASRTARAEEAEELSKQLKTSSRLGFAVDGVKGLFGSMLDRSGGGKDSGSALARGLQSSAMLGGLAGGLKSAEIAHERPSALAQAIGSTASVAGGVAAPGRTSLDGVAPTRPELKRTATDRSDVSVTASVNTAPKDVSLYKLVSDASRILGPPAQEALGQVADLAEKVKNLLLHPDHPSFNPICWRLVGICLVLLLCPTWIQIKFTWAYLGFEFFFLWHLRELYPEYRRALTPWWWLLLGAPTDAEYATFILQKRKQQNKPLRGAKTLKKRAKNRSRAGSEVNATEEASASPSPPRRRNNIKTGLAASLGNLSAIGGAIASSSRASSIHESEEVIGTYFALLQKTPGTIVISTDRVRFAPTKGFRELGTITKLLKKKEEVSDDDASRMSVGEGGGAGMMHLLVEEIVGVRKEKKYGFEGIVITSKEGKAYSLSNVIKRDEAFNKIISIQSSAWKQM